MNRKNMLVETVRDYRGDNFIEVNADADVGTLWLRSIEEQLYRRVANRVPIGVFVGINDHNCIRVGWSRCKLAPDFIPPHILNRFRPEEKQDYLNAIKDSDRFNLNRGITEAIRNIHVPVAPPVHRGFARRFNVFKVRCERYFQNATFIDDRDGEIRHLTMSIPRFQSVTLKCC